MDALPPILLQGQQRIPAGTSSRPTAVDVGSHGPNATFEGSLQRLFTPLVHSLLGARGMFLEIRVQSTEVGPAGIGVGTPGEGFVEMNVSIHEPW